MKKMIFAFGFAAIAAMAAAVVTPSAPVYDIDSSHSNAQFTVRHLMISNVKGTFQKVTGTAVYDPKDLANSRLDATIDVTTVDTQEPKRDAHLKSPDFFDVEKFPSMTFKSKKFVKNGEGLKITGDLTIHGVTKEVTFDVEGPIGEVKDPWGNTRLGATASAKISRKDFGLVWNQALEAGGVAVGDEVKISLEAELVKRK